MICRPINDQDYETACGWWKAQDWEPVHKTFLPETGVIVNDICMGWIYLSNSKVAHAEWIIGNPEVSGPSKLRAINTVLEGLIEIARDHGATFIFSSVKNTSLIKILEKKGFIRTDEGMTNFIYSGPELWAR